VLELELGLGLKLELVWTDGSAKPIPPKEYKEFKRPNKSIAFSVYYNENSTLNRGKRCKYATNNLEAELEAIEYTLYKAPTTHNLLIITNCQATISLINKQTQNDKWGTIHKINKLINKRINKGNKTEISHILAHTDNKKIPKERTDKIAQYLTKYIDKIGGEINPFKGNIQADKLANEAADQNTDWKFDRKRTQVRNSKTLYIKCTDILIPANIKDKCQASQQEHWIKRRSKREPNNLEIPKVTKATILDTM
jgi:ribonuclease HI